MTTATLVGLPCPSCRRPRQTTRSFWCGSEGCEVTEEVELCDCDGGQWRLRADLLEMDGHTSECAEATARAWMARNITEKCALQCGMPNA